MSISVDIVPNLRPGSAYFMNPDVGTPVIVDVLAGSAEYLNESGFGIVARLGRGLTVGEIAKTLSEQWDVPYDQSVQDVCAFLESLDSRGLVIWKPISDLANEYWSPVMRRNEDRYGYRFVPGLVYWEFTNACNLRCLMCYNTSGQERPQEEPIGAKIDRLNKLHEMGTNVVIVTGGEPCTRGQDLEEFLPACNDLGVSTQIFTNGTLVDDRLVELFAKNVSHVRVSLHGGTPATHDRIAGVAGAFDRALQSAKALESAGVSVTWQMTATTTNFDEMRKALDTALDAGLSGFRMGSLDLMGKGREHEDLQLSPEQEVRLWRFLDEATIVYAHRIRVGWGADYCMDGAWLSHVLMPPEKRVVDPTDPRFYMRFCKSSLCGTAMRSVGVRADGALIPCPALSGLPLGQPGEDIRTIWRDSPILNKLRRFDLEGFQSCRQCGTRYLCGAGCRANAFHQSGTITGPDPRRCRGQRHLLSIDHSGFFTRDEIDTGLRALSMTDAPDRLKWFNDVLTEGIGPWVPYWPVISRKWDLEYRGE